MDLILLTTKNGLGLIITLVGIITLPGLVVGLIVALLQSVTQVHEISLAFIPKIIITLVTLLLLFPWYGGLITQFTRELLQQIPRMVN